MGLFSRKQKGFIPPERVNEIDEMMPLCAITMDRFLSHRSEENRQLALEAHRELVARCVENFRMICLSVLSTWKKLSQTCDSYALV